nr:hypothetical protein BDOA9_0153510 [Bradyrhizobium sp. DOA9]
MLRQPVRSRSRGATAAISMPAHQASEAEDAEHAPPFAAPALDDPLAAVLGRAAVIAVMASLVVQIGRLRLSRPPRVADDLDGLTRHCRLQQKLVVRGSSVAARSGGVHIAPPQSGFRTVSPLAGHAIFCFGSVGRCCRAASLGLG